MEIFKKLKEAYEKVTPSSTNEKESLDDDFDSESGILISEDTGSSKDEKSLKDSVNNKISAQMEELFEDSEDDNIAFLKSLTPEMRNFIKHDYSGNDSAANKIQVDGCVCPIMVLTDKPVANQIVYLLGMIKWCLEKSSEGSSGENKEFTLSVKIRNRGKSPFILSIGDVSIPSIPSEESVNIGS